MTSELNQLRRYSNIRQEQIQRRETKYKDDIEKLKRKYEGW